MINDLHLQNFRSYTDESFEFSNGVNIIVGPNASGKTNLLEALLVVAIGSSYRSPDQELISFNNPWSRLETKTNKNRVVKIERSGNKANKTFVINDKSFKRLSLVQTIPIIVFEPNHMLLIGGPPELRRNFIDEILEKTQPEFKLLKRRYNRALSQRNRLLKSINPRTHSEIFVWNIRLSELGGQIFQERNNLVNELQNSIKQLYPTLASSGDKVKLAYRSNCRLDNYETDLLKKLDDNLDVDIERGFTSAGPHRDDLLILLNNHAVVDAASRGESRSLVLTLKIIEAQIIERARNQKPMMLLDDVFSELDGARRIVLTKTLNNNQVFITTTDADVVIHHFTQTANIIPVRR